MSIDQSAIELTLRHQWMTVSEARSLLLHAYDRFKKHARYGMNMVQSLMRIEFGIFLRLEEAELRNRIAIATERF